MPRVLSFHYTLTNTAGNKLDSSEGRGPLTFMEGAGQIIPGLEIEVLKLNVGDKKKIQVAAASAYGIKDKELIIKAPKSALPSKEIKIGDKFRGGADQHSPIFTVVEIEETEVTLDGNHPLAGEDLTFDVEITGQREATAQELEHGHAHGEHGHSH